MFTVRPPIRVDYESAWEHAHAQQIELLGQELEVLREPRPGLSVKHKRGIILQARYLLDRYPDASPYDIHSLIDTGCEIPGVMGWELIDKRYSEDTDVQFNLLGARNVSLEGGKVGVRVTFCCQSTPAREWWWHVV